MKQVTNIEKVGIDWLIEKIGMMDDYIKIVTPVNFNESNRYLPAGVTPRPGYISYDLFPFLKEIIDCFDVMSDVREVNLMKGVQVGYTTLLESILLYYIVHIKTKACMFITADKELATSRLENNIIPMINESGFANLIQSSDQGNARKTGKTRDYLQWSGGGKMFAAGANNPAKMREKSVAVMFKDELDGWKRSVGQDGSSDSLTDARLRAYWPSRKILRGSTPLLEPSMIHESYLRGDQRKYMILCKHCGFPQELRQEAINPETGIIGGFLWETENNCLIQESVRYCCVECGNPHFEEDKEKLFATENGAHWKPTATPKEKDIRSYHLPAFYSPFGFTPWYKCIADYLEGYDPVNKKLISEKKLQVYYNNTLGVPFKKIGSKVRFQSVSGHRRAIYRLGEVPNNYATQYSGSKILFLTCQVDVHKRNLAVSVMGWTSRSCCYVIDYWRFEKDNNGPDCTEITSQVWQRLRDLIETKRYIADDGTEYNILLTLIDAGYSNDTVVRFCGDYVSGVYPIVGRDRPTKIQTIKEFSEFKTQMQTVGYRILVDYYKDRIAPVLRREWVETESGSQKIHHFNAPVDITDDQLKELTVETLGEETDEKGNVRFVWHRPKSQDNELWDLLVYGHAAMEIVAYKLCIQNFELNNVDWVDFWNFASDSSHCSLFGRVDIVE